MRKMDNRPLANTPMSKRISSKHNNRYGAVLSALYAFLASRQVATRNGPTTGAGQDSYSVIAFDHSSQVRDSMHVEKSLTAAADTYGGESYQHSRRTRGQLDWTMFAQWGHKL